MAEEIGNALIALVMVSLIVVGTGLFLGGFTTAYPATAQNVSSENFTFFNRANDINHNISQIADSLQTQQSQPASFFEVTYNIMAGAFGVLMQLFAVGDLLYGLVGGFGIVAASIGINVTWAVTILAGLIVAAVTIWILRAVLKWGI